MALEGVEMRVVMKFGGTSVGSVDAIQRRAAIVNDNRRKHEVVVVVSAMNAPIYGRPIR
jgi:aspartokinase